MKLQLRIMACVITALASGVAIAAVSTNPGASAGSQSTGGQVHFTGEITDTSCNIVSTSADQTVDLGKWAKSYFTNAAETTQTEFHINVTDCPASVKLVSVLFDGTKNAKDATLLSIGTGSGNATGVGIKMYESDKATAIALGTVTAKYPVVAGSGDTGGTADLKFYADYMKDTAPITVGAANGVADFNMVYN